MSKKGIVYIVLFIIIIIISVRFYNHYQAPKEMKVIIQDKGVVDNSNSTHINITVWIDVKNIGAKGTVTFASAIINFNQLVATSLEVQDMKPNEHKIYTWTCIQQGKQRYYNYWCGPPYIKMQLTDYESLEIMPDILNFSSSISNFLSQVP